MSITSAQGYEMRITRKGDKIADPPQPYWQTVERLLADRGIDHVSRLLAYALRDLDQAQGKVVTYWSSLQGSAFLGSVYPGNFGTHEDDCNGT